MKQISLCTLIISLFSFSVLGQFKTVESSHYLLGVDVLGYEVDLPFGKAIAEDSWKTYAKSFGKSDETNKHQSYQTTFRPAIYAKEVLIFTQITGNSTQSKLWAGIDPQGVPKETYPQLQSALEEFVYGFNIKLRTDAAQKQIDESEQAATFLSKNYEDLKRDERKADRNQEQTNAKIVQYEQKLTEFRSDSTTYAIELQTLGVKLDSLNTELEKIKKVVEVYRQKLAEIN